jgi:BASS family bile acid:Na+ symporter
LGQETDVELNVINTVVGIFFITTVPTVIGMLLKAKKSDFADRMEPICRKLASALFVIIIIAAVAKDFKLLTDTFSSVGPATLFLNVITMVIAYFAAKLLKLNDPQARAITFECGLQNGTLAIFIAVTLLGKQELMIPAAIYSLLMFFTGGAFLFKILKKSSI